MLADTPILLAMHPVIGVAVLVVGMMWAAAGKRTAPRLVALVAVVMVMLFVTVPNGGA